MEQTLSNLVPAQEQGKLGRLFALARRRGVGHAASRALRRARDKAMDLYRAKIGVPSKARDAIAAVRASSKRGLFVDCGSNVGQGFQYFRKHFPSAVFDYELFEPNPNCLPYLERIKSQLADHSIVIHKDAVGTKEDFVEFYGLAEHEGGELSQGGSMLKEHNSSFYRANETTSLRVRSIDFSDFIRDRSRQYDVIIVKMDIEGGEYEVMEKIIDDGTVNAINTIFCEFHSQYMEPDGQIVFRRREKDIQRAARRTSCSFVSWR